MGDPDYCNSNELAFDIVLDFDLIFDEVDSVVEEEDHFNCEDNDPDVEVKQMRECLVLPRAAAHHISERLIGRDNDADDEH